MNRTVIHVTAIIVFAICSVSYAQAQTSEVYRADIPFSFSVGNKVYAAGSYRVEVRGFEHKYFVLRDAEGRNPRMANSTPGWETRASGALIDFARVDGHYFLTSISIGDRTSVFPKPVGEGSLARNMAPETVTIAGSRTRASRDGR